MIGIVPSFKPVFDGARASAAGRDEGIMDIAFFMRDYWS
jgi:hypothetical protein